MKVKKRATKQKHSKAAAAFKDISGPFSAAMHNINYANQAQCLPSLKKPLYYY